MGITQTIWADPVDYLRTMAPRDPVMFLSPAALQAQAQRFLTGFPGFVTYAVKANPEEAVIVNLAAAGVAGFDVASPEEIRLIRRLVPQAALHFNNPVRADHEIAAGVAGDVLSYSVDSLSELDKLLARVPLVNGRGDRVEITARFKLPVAGAVYDFGAKFGATEDLATEILHRIAAQGFVPSLTFHPGTQCTDPAAWEAYIHAARRIADGAGTTIARLNVGGGFPSHRIRAEMPSLSAIFHLIDRTTAEVFGDDAPALVCEPGRGLVADAVALLAQVKAVRDGLHVFLNDGIYGAMAELPLMGALDRIRAYAPDGTPRTGEPQRRIVFGPTCDSVDRLPGEIALPEDLAEGDYLLVQGMGAYSVPTNTRFNGFGALALEMALTLEP
ncbi:type III PLP-dependent enzyme [Pararhodobacter sp. SW119]|uniref:type III PLP-dependent enzyme n=1 Tax=Pararhodobacter sp. SW119 TaxID=2780075 RepID=UPI001AE04D5D|nr:type III PLP-dependent enzyme [Pararhodobacter sp. SW119]